VKPFRQAHRHTHTGKVSDRHTDTHTKEDAYVALRRLNTDENFQRERERERERERLTHTQGDANFEAYEHR
jgi:hypothetical protein